MAILGINANQVLMVIDFNPQQDPLSILAKN
jgi:hypothetical protein